MQKARDKMGKERRPGPNVRVRGFGLGRLTDGGVCCYL